MKSRLCPIFCDRAITPIYINQFKKI